MNAQEIVSAIVSPLSKEEKAAAKAAAKLAKEAQAAAKQAVEEEVTLAGVSFLPSAAAKFNADTSSAMGHVAAAYKRAGRKFRKNAFGVIVEDVWTAPQVRAAAKDLVKNHGLQAKVANKWVALFMLGEALTFAKDIGEL